MARKEGKAMTSTEVVPQGTVIGTDLVVPQAGCSVSDLRYALNNGLKLTVNEEAVDEDSFLLTQLSRGSSEEEILGTGLTPLEQLLGIPVRIVAFHGLRNSTFEGSKLGVFCVIDVADVDGKLYTIAGGSADVVVKVLQLAEAAKIPQSGWSMFTKSEKATAAGFYPINLRATADPNGF